MLLVIKLDICKAFDTVFRSSVLAAMQHRRVHPCVLSAFVEMWRSERSIYQVGPLKSAARPLFRGVRQGDPCSPMLFRWVLEDLLIPLQDKWTQDQVSPVFDGSLHHLHYADDVLLFAKDRDQATSMIRELEQALSSAGLYLSITKAEVCCTYTHGWLCFAGYKPAYANTGKHCSVRRIGYS